MIQVAYDGMSTAPEGATVEFIVTPGAPTEADGSPGNNLLTINEIALVSDGFIGTVTNTATRDAIWPYIGIVCFDATIAVLGAASGSTTQTQIAPGGLGTFSIFAFTPIPSCERFVIAADA